MTYRVVYLVRARRAWLPGNFYGIVEARKEVQALKRRGMTAWVVNEDGSFVPVKGAMRQPGYLE